MASPAPAPASAPVPACAKSPESAAPPPERRAGSAAPVTDPANGPSATATAPLVVPPANRTVDGHGATSTPKQNGAPAPTLTPPEESRRDAPGPAPSNAPASPVTLPPPLPQKDSIYAQATDKTLTPEQKQNLQRVIDAGATITIYSVPPGAETDGIKQAFTIDKQNASAINAPIQVNGIVTGITVSLPGVPSKDPQVNLRQRTINGEPLSGTGVDQFGNSFGRGYVVGDEVKRHVNFTPPLPLGNGATEQYRPVGIDLTHCKGPDGTPLPAIPGLAEQRTIPPVGQVGPYRVYSQATPQNPPSREILESLAHGALDAEKAWRAPAGTKVTNIVIENSNHQNAYFNPASPNTIVLQDEVLKLPAGATRAVARHEAFHLLDNLTKNKLGEAFGARFNSGPPMYGNVTVAEFKGKINESAFGKGGFGGHADENNQEFFASYVNSLNHPRFEAVMKQQSPEFRENYLQTARCLRDALKDTGLWDKGRGPLADLVGQRVKQVNRMQGRLFG